MEELWAAEEDYAAAELDYRQCGFCGSSAVQLESLEGQDSCTWYRTVRCLACGRTELL